MVCRTYSPVLMPRLLNVAPVDPSLLYEVTAIDSVSFCVAVNFMSESSQNNDLRNRILFTIMILCVYRFGTFVPLPGIDPQQLQCDALHQFLLWQRIYQVRR